MRSPCADHRGRAAGMSPKVIWTGSPFPSGLIQTCGVTLASLTNAIVRPSGDSVGHRCDPENVEISSRLFTGASDLNVVEAARRAAMYETEPMTTAAAATVTAIVMRDRVGDVRFWVWSWSSVRT